MIVYIDFEKETGKIKSVCKFNYEENYTKLETNLNLNEIFDYKYINSELVKLTPEEKAQFYPTKSSDDFAGTNTNQNILTNSDFIGGIINQKGKTTYTEADKISIDMWRIIKNLTLTIKDKYIHLKNNSTTENGYFIQRFNSTLKDLNTYTIYVNVKALTGKAYVFLENNTDSLINSEKFYLKEGSNEITFKAKELFDRFGIALEQNAEIEIYQMKLEKGYSFTGVSVWYKAQQLAECQRKLVVLNSVKNTSVGKTGKKIAFTIPLPVKMKKLPSVTLDTTGSFGASDINYWTNGEILQITATCTDDNLCSVNINKAIIDSYEY